MKYGDENHNKRLDFISMIPSNKIDTDNLKNISDQDMERYNEKHLRDLREQVMGYDEEELEVVAEAITEIGWTFTYNALGNYFEKITKKIDTIREINQ